MKTQANLLLLPTLIVGLGSILACRVTAQTFTNLHSFTATSGTLSTNGDGVRPLASLVLSANTLYGTASGGGSSGMGTVFAVNTDGSGFTNLHNFTATTGIPPINGDGANPVASLILSGNTMYGTAGGNGTSSRGTVFAINTDGNGYKILHTFTGGSNGANPYSGLILSGDTLYGTAESGGNSGKGMVFVIRTDSTGFTNLYSFNGAGDGANPFASLILSGDTFYGTAESGGSFGVGT